MTNNIPSRPLEFPACRGERIGHYCLIAIMLPMLIVVALAGFLFGTYRRALKHAAVARSQAESHSASA
jgi:hypothetical protein